MALVKLNSTTHPDGDVIIDDSNIASPNRKWAERGRLYSQGKTFANRRLLGDKRIAEAKRLALIVEAERFALIVEA